MFNTKITAKVYELKEMLLHSREYEEVKNKERLMEENCANLLIKYNDLFNKYNDALRFKDYGSDVASAQKSLFNCKKELDNNPYVQDYKNSYRKMNQLLQELQSLIFENIIENRNINL